MQNADAALRVLSPRNRANGVPGPGDKGSLQNVNTTELPNGALCYVTSEGGSPIDAALYRFDKSSHQNNGTVTPVGGPGRWFPIAQTGILFELGIPISAGAVLVASTSAFFGAAFAAPILIPATDIVVGVNVPFTSSGFDIVTARAYVDPTIPGIGLVIANCSLNPVTAPTPAIIAIVTVMRRF